MNTNNPATAGATPVDFSYESRAQRVVFGYKRLSELPLEADLLGLRKILILCTPGQRELAELASLALGNVRVVGIFDKAKMHVPDDIAREACDAAVLLDADGVVAIGGGSTIGLGKAIALELGLPIVAVPTTYAGSEMTCVYGITRAGLKTTGFDPRVLPRTVIYDPSLTEQLPAHISVTSALNAIAHAAEGLYAKNRNPVTDLMAEAGIAALANALPKLRMHGLAICDEETMRKARTDAFYGAWLCGSVLGNVSMALHHKLCHTLGGSFNLPHAEVHSIILPHALAYNAEAAPQAMECIARAIRAGSAPLGMHDLIRASGAPTALRDIGMRESDLSHACELVMSNQYPNPRPIEREAIKKLLRDAFEGIPPDS